ncbi:MAG: FAD-dependent thymidylate synthase [Acidithiobacillus sp.]|jgi:thymidylate synthase (FAD)|uniref:FAD-dependent thymidylate synthase n=1 Tax=Acidithiobacillus sp. TaxID=1872118 RepID=UPI0035601BC0
MGHCISPAAEKLLDQQFAVLDHGFVRLVDYMGNDDRIVQSARVSYGNGTKSVSEDKALIDYLLRNKHTSPFEQVVVVLHCKMPIFVARQWVRHRTARLNEVSGRYSELKSEAYLPLHDRIQNQSKTNKQGSEKSGLSQDYQDIVREMMHDEHIDTFKNYDKYLHEFDISREIARINLPLSTYTEWYWQMDLNNLFHFLSLRLDAHAQWEIQQYGIVIAKIVKAIVPNAYESFINHKVRSVTFSGTEMDLLRKVFDINDISNIELGSSKKIEELKAKFVNEKLDICRNIED